MKQRESGVNRMYVQLMLTDHDHETDLWSWGGEPIYRNGKYVGATTTTGYGYTFKKQVSRCFDVFIPKRGGRKILFRACRFVSVLLKIWTRRAPSIASQTNGCFRATTKSTLPERVILQK